MAIHTPSQAIVRIVPHGGARTAQQLARQWKYLSRRGEVYLQRSRRHLDLAMPKALLQETAHSWITQTGAPADKNATREFTTHIVVSFPPGTDVERAFATGREWAEEMFGSGRYGGTFDYITACHGDRPHPHVHLVINRRALEGHWLKIARRNAFINYETMRSVLVHIAQSHGISLDATTRGARGILEAPITFAEYRRRARADVAEQGGGEQSSG